jgi:hypothetical protein
MLLAMFYIFKINKKTSTENTTTNNSSNLQPLGSNAAYQKSANQISKEETMFVERESKVGQLLNKLPYQGKNFDINYDISTAVFRVKIRKENEVEGNKEFDQFLKENSINERSWIRNLEITEE